MANYKFTSDIINDVEFRSGELMDGSSPLEGGILQFINRAYNSLIMGGAEFNDGESEEWWWLRKDPPGTLILEAPVTTGTVTVTNNNATITLTSAPAVSKATWFFKVDQHSDVFRIAAHTGGSASMTLDSVYTGLNGAALNYKLFKLEYTLATDVIRVIAPMVLQSGGRESIDGVELVTMSRDYPLTFIESGTPNQFANVTDTKVRFNRYGINTGGSLIRVEYDYLALPPILTKAANEESLVPLQYRQLLADIAYYYLIQAKSKGTLEESNKLSNIGNLIKLGVKAMCNEQHHRMIVHGAMMGKIQPRQDNLQRFNRPLRTASGVIIG